MDSFCGVGDLNEDQTTPASKIGCNAVVLLSIARASDFSTLKSLRLVNTFCLQVVSLIFNKRASVKLKPGERSLKSLRSFAKDTKGIEGKLKIVKIICDSQTDLELEEGTAFNDILCHLSTSLESLELDPQNIHGHIVFYARIESKAQFPVLRTLHLVNIHIETLGMLSKLFEASPALENLKLCRLSAPGHYIPFVLSPLQITAEDGSIARNWDLAPNLRSLTVFLALSPFEAESLTNFSQAWKALVLCLNSSHGPGRVGTALEQLLEKNKDSLLCLKLKYNCCDDEPHSKVQLQLPSSFSKLKLLQFFFKGRDFDHISFGFGRSKDLIEYSKLCPSLERVLIVAKLESQAELKSIWSKFFPQFVSRKSGKRLKWFVQSKGWERKKVEVEGMVLDPSNNIIWNNILGIGSVAQPPQPT